MGERIITFEQRRWLQKEVSEWQRIGLLSAETATRIAELYVPADVTDEQKKAKVIYVLMGIAALLAGIAVLLLIGFNWQALSGTVKLITLFSVMGGIYGGSWYLRYRKKEQRLSEVGFFLACLLYGANIWLVQQVFQVSASPTVGLFWWAVGIVPFVLLLDTLLFHSFLVALLVLWSLVADNFFGWFDSTGVWWQNWLPACLVLLPVALLGLLEGHRRQRPALIKLYLPLLVWWAVLPLWQYDGWAVLPVLGIFGTFLLYIEGKVARTEAIRSSYRQYGVLLAGGALLPLGYYGWTTEFLNKAGQTTAMMGVEFAVIVISVGILYLLARHIRYQQHSQSELQEQLIPILLTLLFGGFLLLKALHPVSPETIVLLLTILANLGTIGLVSWMIHRGIQEERGRMFSFGIFYLLLWICLRYLDLFGEMGGMLGAACLFAFCAAVLFGVAFYWRNRKGVSHA